MSEFLKLRFCPLMIGARPLGDHSSSMFFAGLAPLLFFWRLPRPIAGVGVLKQPVSLLIREGGALSRRVALILEEEAAIRMGCSHANQSEHGKPAERLGKVGYNRHGLLPFV
ncbi:hypothetical protein [Thiobacter aerophilum]|uniref:Uncharacterized protein n=1 Tax=Thiobacter aerophilum TaxID=3121275 RepID=A0ABV0EJY6_9BURK